VRVGAHAGRADNLITTPDSEPQFVRVLAAHRAVEEAGVTQLLDSVSSCGPASKGELHTRGVDLQREQCDRGVC
jgi:hypothetical protein